MWGSVNWLGHLPGASLRLKEFEGYGIHTSRYIYVYVCIYIYVYMYCPLIKGFAVRGLGFRA